MTEVTINNNRLVNTKRTKPLCASSSNLEEHKVIVLQRSLGPVF